MAKVSLSHIYKVYPNGVKAVNDFNMEIEDKEFIVFVGPSGCGKSTTLRMIAGLEDISAGELRIGNEIVNDVEPKERDIAMVFQNYALYPHMTVYENMAFGLKIRKVPRDEIHRRILEAAEILDLTEYLDRKPKAMSGGQRQRVALGRAILRNPKVFLLDEPLSNLDAKLRTQMRAEISKLHKKLGTTFIYVTHDQVEAMTMGTRIVVMKKGFVQQIDTPKNLYRFPINKFVAGFIGTPQMNFFDVTLKRNGDVVECKFVKTNQVIEIPYNQLIKVKPEYLNGDRIVIAGIRCEYVSVDSNKVASSSQVIEVKVSHMEELGNETLLYANIDINSDGFKDEGTRIIIKSFGDREFEQGQVLSAALDFASASFFDAQTEETIVPRIPTENIVDYEVIDNNLIFLNNTIALPKALHMDDCSGTLNIPTSALEIVETSNKPTFKGTVKNVEYILNKYLVHVDINGRLIFVVAPCDYEVGQEVNLALDLKYLKIGEKLASNLINSLPLKFLKVKEKVEVNGKMKKVVNFKLNILDVDYYAPDSISSRIFAALSTKAFDHNYRIDFSPYALNLSNNGIRCEVEEIIDYGYEKFAKLNANGRIIYFNVNDDIDGTVFINIDFNNVGITETSIDMKLI